MNGNRRLLVVLLGGVFLALGFVAAWAVFESYIAAFCCAVAGVAWGVISNVTPVSFGREYLERAKADQADAVKWLKDDEARWPRAEPDEWGRTGKAGRRSRRLP